MNECYCDENDIVWIRIISGKHGIVDTCVDKQDYLDLKLDKKTLYAWKTPRHSTLYVIVQGETPERLHRLVARATNRKQIVDHIDGNGLNNCRNNLRITTQFGNTKNTGANKTSKGSKFKGVDVYKDGRFRAQIQVDKKKIFLGYFEKEVDAAKAYNEASLKYHGEFAYINSFDEAK